MTGGACSNADPGRSTAHPAAPTLVEIGPAVVRSFCFGPENRAVAVALSSLLGGDAPAPSGRCPFSPLLLVGPGGVGKSHLACGFVADWRARRGPDGVVYSASKDFARQFAEAIERDEVPSFRRNYRTARLLVLEDIAQLKTKRAAQQELLCTLDALAEAGSPVVATSSIPPTNLRQIAPALASRLVGGLVLPVAPPGEQARREILSRLARDSRIALPDAAARLLAGSLPGTAPELRAALLELHVACQTKGAPLDARQAREYLSRRSVRNRSSIDQIAALTAKSFSLRQAQMRGASRKRSIALARSIAMYLARKITGASLQQIGRYFGGRDHTTVMHNCRKIERAMVDDAATRSEVDRLQRLLCAH